MSIEVMTAVWKHAPVQSGELLILLALADYADEDGGCFPAVETLAKKARMSGRNVQRCLNGLEESGLISVRRNTGPKGCNRYIVETENLRKAAAKPALTGDNMSPPPKAQGVTSAHEGVTESTPGGDAHVTQTVIEPPVETPSIERERGREESLEKESPKSVEAAYWRLVKDWPGFAGMPKEAGLRPWLGLTGDEREAAAARYPAWIALLRRQGKTQTPAPSTYFRERLWEAAGPAPAVDAVAAASVPAPAFGPLWQALRFALLAEGVRDMPPLPAMMQAVVDANPDGAAWIREKHWLEHGWPKISALHSRAKLGEGRDLPVDLAARLQGAAEDMEPVPVGSDAWQGWKDYHAARGWPWLPDTGKMAVVYFPKGGPPV